MLKKWMLLLLLCLLPGLALADAQTLVFGQSELGRDLTCVRVGSGDAEKAMLMVFGAHGFEDVFDRDGQVLKDIANALIAHYDAQPDGLNGHALYIVPCLNPDGLAEGTSKDGFGRLNANGLDINRDFPEGWTRKQTARNRTGEEPFTTAEARALRSLVETLRPAWGVDVHGWINGVYGDKALAASFQEAFGFDFREYRSGGMIAQWLDTVTEAAVMVELPGNPGHEQYVERISQKLIQALDHWFACQ